MLPVLKEDVSIISSDPLCKDGNARWYPRNLKLINHVDSIWYPLNLKLINRVDSIWYSRNLKLINHVNSIWYPRNLKLINHVDSIWYPRNLKLINHVDSIWHPRNLNLINHVDSIWYPLNLKLIYQWIWYGTLETLDWSIMCIVEGNVVFLTRKALILIITQLFIISKKFANHLCREPTNENKIVII